MTVLYVGILIHDPTDIESTEVFYEQEKCEEFCSGITDNYYVVEFNVDIDSSTLH